MAIFWASETQLRLGDLGGDAFLRYSNAWAPVQAYYGEVATNERQSMIWPIDGSWHREEALRQELLNQRLT